MDQSLPALQGPRQPRKDWVLGASAVGIFGLACLAAAVGIAAVVHPLLQSLVPHVAGLALAPWLLGVVCFLLLELPQYLLIGGALLGVGRLSRGPMRRFFWGLPLVALSFALGIVWPLAPDGLAPATLRVVHNLRWGALGVFMVAVATWHLYSWKRRTRG